MNEYHKALKEPLPVEEAQAIVETKTAPRVTEQSIKDKIASIDFLYHKHLTICVIQMNNGFMVVGKAAPASIANFDAEVGRSYSYQDAFKQLWHFEGYALCERLYHGNYYEGEIKAMRDK